MRSNPDILAELFGGGESLRFLAVFAAPNGFDPPNEIYSVYAGGDNLEQALERARQGGSRLQSLSVERFGANEAAWPDVEPPSAEAYVLRASHWVVFVPSLVTVRRPLWPPSVHVLCASPDEEEARRACGASPIRAMLCRVGTIVAGDGGGELGGIQKENGRIWTGW